MAARAACYRGHESETEEKFRALTLEERKELALIDTDSATPTQTDFNITQVPLPGGRKYHWGIHVRLAP